MIKVITVKDIQKAIKPIKPFKPNDAYSIARILSVRYPGSVTLELDKYYVIDEERFYEFCKDMNINVKQPNV